PTPPEPPVATDPLDDDEYAPDESAYDKIVEAVKRRDYPYLSKELLGIETKKLTTELAHALIKRIADAYELDTRATNLAELAPLFVDIVPDDYREVHNALLKQVWEMNSFFYSGRILSAVVELLIARGEYDWALNFAKRFRDRFETDEAVAETLLYGLDDFDESLITEEYHSSTENRMRPERCRERIGERVYEAGDKGKALEYFKDALGEAFAAGGVDPAKIVLAMTMHFLARHGDGETAARIREFLETAAKDKTVLHITVGDGIGGGIDRLDAGYFTALFDWLQSHLGEKYHARP
ncbi:MAG TPA: hypothetical protein PKH10_14185, partial [bacterium]|nr:hypothetical protein [bacterium]